MQNLDLSLIIPVYNEQDNIEPLVQEIIQAIGQDVTQDLAYEIIVIDDGSEDNTVAKTLTCMAQYPAVRLIQHKANAGQSAAILSGAKVALAPWLMTLDGDRQNDPADIPAVWAARQDNKTVVFGNRRHRNDSCWKKISSRVGNAWRRFFLRDDCPDTGCSLKLFPKDGFLALPHFNHCHRFLPTLFQRAGFRTLNLPVNHRPRIAGQSKYGALNRAFVGIIDVLGVLWLCRRSINTESVDE